MKKLISALVTFLFFINHAYSDQLQQIKTSTTSVLKEVRLSNNNYSIGLGVGVIPPNATKPWKSHSLAEVVYVINGKAIVNYKPKLKETYITDQSYQIKTDTFHQTQSGSDGLSYVVIWGQKIKTQTVILADGTPVKPLEDKLKKIALEKVNQTLKSRASIVKKTSFKVLESQKIPQSPYTVFMKLGTLSHHHNVKLQKTSEPRIMYLLSGDLSIAAAHLAAQTYHSGESFILKPHVSYNISAGKNGAKYILGGATGFKQSQ